jgi:hypothetical protein
MKSTPVARQRPTVGAVSARSGRAREPGDSRLPQGMNVRYGPRCACVAVPSGRAAGPAEDGAKRRPQAVVRRLRSAVGGASHGWWRAPVRARALDLCREIRKTLGAEIGVRLGRCRCGVTAHAGVHAALPWEVSSFAVVGFAVVGMVRARARRAVRAWAVSGVMWPSSMIPTPKTLTSACR